MNDFHAGAKSQIVLDYFMGLHGATGLSAVCDCGIS